MKNLKIHLTIALLMVIAQSSMAQIDIKNDMKKNFDSFKKDSRQTFDDFVKANDEAFSAHLRQAWEQLDALTEVKPNLDPKPEKKPVMDSKVKVENIIIKATEPEEQPKVEAMSSAPIKPKSEPSNFPVNSVSVPFFGKEFELDYDKNFVTTVDAPVNNNIIADYWDMMITTNHYHLIDQFQELKTTLNLNDWGYYEVVSKSCEKICPTDKNAARLLCWFILAKSNYQARVGFAPDGVHLLMAFQNQIYSKPYFNIDGKKYYVLERVDRLSTYRQDYKVATEEVCLDITSPMKIGAVIEKKSISFEYNGKTYSYTVDYPLNDIAFYKSYPQADIKVYFDAAVSDQTRASLTQSIKPDLAGLSEEESVNFLLALVQKSFDYKTDPEQFGSEKFFFAEEVLFYPYSDCEDRAVLFSFLVKELLGLKVVGLRYPGHMATAVLFSKNVVGARISYEGAEYTVCDPTYINASVGQCMPQFTNEVGVVVPLR
jgi:hypothetical protein